MSGHHHERLVCSCGAVIMQCRCFEPKTDRVAQDGCNACKTKKIGAAPACDSRWTDGFGQVHVCWLGNGHYPTVSHNDGSVYHWG